MTTKPRSRRPESWPSQVVAVFTAAISGEVLVPFENAEKLKSLKRVLSDVRRSYREHNHALAPEINALSILEYSTYEMMKTRPHYRPENPDLFPLTAAISPALGFTTNISNAAVTPHVNIESPLPPPVNLQEFAIDMELLAAAKDFEEDDQNALADIFGPKRD